MKIDQIKTTKLEIEAEFEGSWHALEFQPDLSVPQKFVIGALLSRKGKIVAFRVAEEAPRLKCFYADRFSKQVWRYLKDEIHAEMKSAMGSAPGKFRSASPQISLSPGAYVSGISLDSALSRTFDRIVTVVGGEKRVRMTGVPQAELRTSMAQLLKVSMRSKYEEISRNETGILIQDGDLFRSFDITYDDAKVASSVVSASYASLESSSLNIYKAMNDLTTFKAIREREQIGIAVLTPSTDYFSKQTVQVWNDWWSNESYKLKQSRLLLVAESDRVEVLADQVLDWYGTAAP